MNKSKLNVTYMLVGMGLGIVFGPMIFTQMDHGTAVGVGIALGGGLGGVFGGVAKKEK